MGSSLGGPLPKGSTSSMRSMSKRHLQDRKDIVQKTKQMDRDHARDHRKAAAQTSNKDVKKYQLKKAEGHEKNLKKVTVEAKKISTKLKGS